MIHDREWTPDRLAEDFRRLSETGRIDHAPLFEHAAARVAEDQELLAIAASVNTGQPAYLFFGALHYLLLGGIEHQLGRYYPSLTESPLPAQEAYPAVRDFALQHADDIREIVTTHHNQVNEVGRTAALLPAFSEAARRGGRQPLAIVEVGCSAGLNLCFDRFHYDYGPVQWGDPISPARVTCRLEDGRPPLLEDGLPQVGYRIGLDINPIDLTDPAAARWLLALTWPDHRDLSELQRNAIAVLQQDPPRLVRGDALELPHLLADVPQDLRLCVYQSYMLNQLPPEAQQRFIELLAEESARRPVYFISMAGAGTGLRRSRVDLHIWTNGRHESQQLVEGHSHGRSIKWLG
jgi:hypothetical protein